MPCLKTNLINSPCFPFFMEYKGLVLDKFQEDAIISIESNHSVVVSAPTGSGKTLISDYIIKRHIEKGIKVVYAPPKKAVSKQKYRKLWFYSAFIGPVYTTFMPF